MLFPYQNLGQTSATETSSFVFVPRETMWNNGCERALKMLNICSDEFGFPVVARLLIKQSVGLECDHTVWIEKQEETEVLPPERSRVGQRFVAPSCAGCADRENSEDKFNRCVCGAVTYCSRKCQKRHWPEHKSRCRKLRNVRSQLVRAARVDTKLRRNKKKKY